MRRHSMIGLCLMAVLAVCACATASASAAGPEFGRCIKKAKAGGSGYSDGNCTEKAEAEAKYEWLAGPGPKPGFTTSARFVATEKTLLCRKWKKKIEEAEEAEAKGEKEIAKLRREEAEELLKKHKLTAPTCEKLLEENGGKGEGKEPAVLEETDGESVECSGVSTSGEYTSATTVSLKPTVFTGCEIPTSEPKGIACETAGYKEGEVVTASLEGVLGVIHKEPNPINDTAGIALSPAAGGTTVTELECGPIFGGALHITVIGSVIHKVTVNKMLLTEDEQFVQKDGIQKPEAFEGQPADVLETSLGGPYLQSGEELLTKLTNEEKIEVNTTV